MVQLRWDAYVVLVTLIAGLVVMAGDWVGPDLVFAGMVGFLTASRILSVEQSTAGFASNGLLTVVILFVVAEGIGQTGGMERALNVFLGKTANPFWAITRMFIPVAITSAFLNNTPIVALLIPIMIAWGRRNRVSPKKLLIPLSYAAVFGGTLTLIGTSTNLVIASLQERRYRTKAPQDAKFNMFDITPYGIVYAIFGFIYTVVASHWLLPAEETKRHSDLLLVARVPPHSPVANNTVREAGLKGMERLFLVAVERQGRVTHAVGPQYLLEAGDHLYFCGELDQAHFYAKAFSLELLTNESVGGLNGKGNSDPSALENGTTGGGYNSAKIVQASVKKGADIIGKTVGQIEFRKRFDVAVLGLKRGEAHQPGPLSEMTVNAGDVIVLMAEGQEVLEKPEIKAVFKEIETLDEALEKEYLTAMRVTSKFKGVGKNVNSAGLRGINGLSLVAIDRASGQHVKAIEDDTVVETGDTLWFAGGVFGVHFLLKLPGLEHTQAPQVSKLRTDILYRQLVKASVASESPLVGSTVREAHFRNKYDAVVLAIHRQGERLSTDVRDVKLRPGDVLLLDTGSNFEHRYRNDAAFSLITGVPESSPVKKSRMWIALILGFLMIATQIVDSVIGGPDLINLFIAGILTAGFMLLSRCLNADQARNSIDWRVYTTIAFAFAFSTSLENTNLAKAIANIFIDISKAVGGLRASYIAMYIATALLSELVSNNAAAAIMYPIAAELGDVLGVVPTRMSVVVMLGASAGFTLPYSYQTNLMVYAAGDYRFMEFAKFGLPCQAFMIVAIIFIFLLDDKIWVAVGISFVLMLLVIASHLLWQTLPVSVRRRFSPRRKKNSTDLAVMRTPGPDLSKQSIH